MQAYVFISGLNAGRGNYFEEYGEPPIA